MTSLILSESNSRISTNFKTLILFTCFAGTGIADGDSENSLSPEGSGVPSDAKGPFTLTL